MAEVELMSRRHKDLGSGQLRGPGHYSQDGRRWWDDGHQRWFPVTDQEDQLEIEVENYAETSLFNRLWSGFFTQWGSPSYFRFVGRAHSADPRWPTYRVVGATFPETDLDDPSKEPWANEQRASLEELHQRLLREGWQRVGHGEHWWSLRYRRPVVDLTGAGPAEAGATVVR
jgi:hypothetical protein